MAYGRQCCALEEISAAFCKETVHSYSKFTHVFSFNQRKICSKFHLNQLSTFLRNHSNSLGKCSFEINTFKVIVNEN